MDGIDCKDGSNRMKTTVGSKGINKGINPSILREDVTIRYSRLNGPDEKNKGIGRTNAIRLGSSEGDGSMTTNSFGIQYKGTKDIGSCQQPVDRIQPSHCNYIDIPRKDRLTSFVRAFPSVPVVFWYTATGDTIMVYGLEALRKSHSKALVIIDGKMVVSLEVMSDMSHSRINHCIDDSQYNREKLLGFLNAIRWSASLTGNQRVVLNRIGSHQGDALDDLLILSSIIKRSTNQPSREEQDKMGGCIERFNSMPKRDLENIFHTVDRQFGCQIDRIKVVQPRRP